MPKPLNFYHFDHSLYELRQQGPIMVGPYQFNVHQTVYSKRLYWKFIGPKRRIMENIRERWEGSEVRLMVVRASRDYTCIECEKFIPKESLHGAGNKSVAGREQTIHYCLECVVPANKRIGPLRLMEPPKGYEYYAHNIE